MIFLEGMQARRQGWVQGKGPGRKIMVRDTALFTPTCFNLEHKLLMLRYNAAGTESSWIEAGSAMCGEPSFPSCDISL